MKVSPISLLFLLSLFLSHCKTVQKPESEVKFGAAEHRELGQAGYEKACEAFPCPPKIARLDKTEAFAYGELVALSGDFYDKWEAVEADKGHSIFPVDPNFNDIEYFRKAVEEEYEAMQRQQTDSTVSLPSKDANYVYAFGIEYAALATANVDHFGWHNMKRYVKDHKRAIEEAIKGFQEKDPEKKNDHLRLALLINGFSDHFLTDGFASGHVRVPRSQGIEWGQDKGWVSGNSATLGVLAKILHDNDHPHTKDNEGLKVLNSNKDSWYTRADGQLYLDSSPRSPHRILPIKAVQSSVTEVLEAFQTGREPAGVYAATRFVPFIDPTEQKLTEAFPKTADVSPYIQAAGIMKVALSAQNVKDFFAALPELMQKFRADVAADISADPELSKRLPKEYLEGYRKVQ